ncbi:zinc finger protein 479-like [Achroia grisella]|uniref:zinc finger protein 479-like n=1 Tax=Achroia grisella TaxID=688607 RepID=UPI0027D20A16|nr:zinc finger protein 479-like [Achroia grisella]
MESNICHICLSDNRILQQPTEILRITLKMLTPGLDIQRLCWECNAHLKHANILMRNALLSKHILDEYALGQNCCMIPKSNLNFSNLSIISSPEEITDISGIHKNDLSKFSNKLNSETTHIKKVQHSRLNMIKKSEYSVQTANSEQKEKNISEKESGNVKRRSIVLKKVNYKRRNRLRAAKNDYKCKECSKVFESRGKYEYHKQKHNGGLQCPICMNTLASRAALAAHRRAKHARQRARTDDTNYYCQPCGKFFKTNCSYRKHQRTASTHVDISTLKYTCQNCDMRFPSSAKMKQHNDTVHLRMNLLICDICNKRYCSARALDNHKRRKHSSDARIRCFMCEACGYRFKTFQILKRHLQTHFKGQLKEGNKT